VTDTTPVSGKGGFLTPGVALAILDAFAKFKEPGFTPTRSRDPDHTRLGGGRRNFYPYLELAVSTWQI